jgi:hypothetical protein
VGKPDENRPPERPRYKRNIEMNFEEIGWEDVEWIDMAYGRDLWLGPANRVMNFRRHKQREMFLPAVKRLALH